MLELCEFPDRIPDPWSSGPPTTALPTASVGRTRAEDQVVMVQAEGSNSFWERPMRPVKAVESRFRGRDRQIRGPETFRVENPTLRFSPMKKPLGPEVVLRPPRPLQSFGPLP